MPESHRQPRFEEPLLGIRLHVSLGVPEEVLDGVVEVRVVRRGYIRSVGDLLYGVHLPLLDVVGMDP